MFRINSLCTFLNENTAQIAQEKNRRHHNLPWKNLTCPLFYSTILSIKATFPNLNKSLLIFGLGAFGAGAALLDLLDLFVEFLIYLSIVFIPVAGVIIADYVMIQRGSYRIETLENNRKFAPKAFAAWGIGAIASLLMYYYPNISPSGIAAIDAIALTALSYLLLAWTNRRDPPATEKTGD